MFFGREGFLGFGGSQALTQPHLSFDIGITVCSAGLRSTQK